MGLTALEVDEIGDARDARVDVAGERGDAEREPDDREEGNETADDTLQTWMILNRRA